MSPDSRVLPSICTPKRGEFSTIPPPGGNNLYSDRTPTTLLSTFIARSANRWNVKSKSKRGDGLMVRSHSKTQIIMDVHGSSVPSSLMSEKGEGLRKAEIAPYINLGHYSCFFGG